MKPTFENWFADLTAHARHSLGYDGPIHEETFRDQYENDFKDAATAAEEFVHEMNS